MILVTSRSVNTIIWALLFVAIFGPGSLAGILAITFRSLGFLGKLMGEAIEEIDRRPSRRWRRPARRGRRWCSTRSCRR